MIWHIVIYCNTILGMTMLCVFLTTMIPVKYDWSWLIHSYPVMNLLKRFNQRTTNLGHLFLKCLIVAQYFWRSYGLPLSGKCQHCPINHPKIKCNHRRHTIMKTSWLSGRETLAAASRNALLWHKALPYQALNNRYLLIYSTLGTTGVKSSAT